MRLRLKANYDISGFSAKNQVILTALKKYGMILADNGTSMFITGAPDDRWDDDDLHKLGQVQASAFEVVQMNPVYTSANVPQGNAPAISGLTATSTTISAGQSTTLSWTVSGASYLIMSRSPARSAEPVLPFRRPGQQPTPSTPPASTDNQAAISPLLSTRVRLRTQFVCSRRYNFYNDGTSTRTRLDGALPFGHARTGPLRVRAAHFTAAEQAIKERKRAIHQQPGSRNKCRP